MMYSFGDNFYPSKIIGGGGGIYYVKLSTSYLQIDMLIHAHTVLKNLSTFLQSLYPLHVFHYQFDPVQEFFSSKSYPFPELFAILITPIDVNFPSKTYP